MNMLPKADLVSGGCWQSSKSRNWLRLRLSPHPGLEWFRAQGLGFSWMKCQFHEWHFISMKKFHVREWNFISMNEISCPWMQFHFHEWHFIYHVWGVHQAEWLICCIHKTFKTFGEAGKFVSAALAKAMGIYIKIGEVAGWGGHRQCGVVPNSIQLNVHNVGVLIIGFLSVRCQIVWYRFGNSKTCKPTTCKASMCNPNTCKPNIM